MNRVIKFRAWDGEQMLSPDYINRNGYACWKANSIPETSNRLMQFTGLKDKNNNDIYEGDIITCHTTGDFKWPHKGIVEYVGCSFEIKVGKNFENDNDQYTYFWCNENFEIIGNIYENPELIN